MYNKVFMELAIEIAKQGINEGCGGPFGCVIVKEGQVIATAHNTVVADNDPTAHGEMNAIREACKKVGTFNLKGCELYTTSEPCPMCLGGIMWSRIDTVYSAMTIQDAKYIGFDDEPFYKAIVDYVKGYPIEMVRTEVHKESEAKELFEEYKNMEKVLY